MEKMILEGKAIGKLGSFSLMLNRLTVLTAGCGMGKSLVARALAFMANAGAAMDETVLCNMIDYHFSLVEDVIHRINDSELEESEKEKLLDTLEAEGLHEDNVALFRKKGFVTKEEEKEFKAYLLDDYTTYVKGVESVFSPMQREIIKDAVLANFPGLFQDAWDEKGEHTLSLSSEKGGEDLVYLAFSAEGELEKAYLPFIRNAVYISESPLSAGPYDEDADYSYDYETVRERMYSSIVNHMEKEDDEWTEEERAFFAKLDKAVDTLLSGTIGGTVDYDAEEREFSYTRTRDGAKFYIEDMSRSAQMISDIALMAKKRQILPGSIVIFDSVDSLLDIDWQEKLASFINELLVIGVQVFVTTRSGYAKIQADHLEGIPMSQVTWLRGIGDGERTTLAE